MRKTLATLLGLSGLAFGTGISKANAQSSYSVPVSTESTESNIISSEVWSNGQSLLDTIALSVSSTEESILINMPSAYYGGLPLLDASNNLYYSELNLLESGNNLDFTFRGDQRVTPRDSFDATSKPASGAIFLSSVLTSGNVSFEDIVFRPGLYTGEALSFTGEGVAVNRCYFDGVNTSSNARAISLSSARSDQAEFNDSWFSDFPSQAMDIQSSGSIWRGNVFRQNRSGFIASSIFTGNGDFGTDAEAGENTFINNNAYHAEVFAGSFMARGNWFIWNDLQQTDENDILNNCRIGTSGYIVTKLDKGIVNAISPNGVSASLDVSNPQTGLNPYFPITTPVIGWETYR